MDQTPSETAGLFPRRVGERLAEARRAKGLELADVAARTRIPLRALEAIERSDLKALPAATYSVGFVRTYATAIGLDPVVIARDFRSELGQIPAPHVTQPFEPADPARVPPRSLVIVALIIAVLIAAAYATWRTGLFSGTDADDRARMAAGIDGQTTPAPAAPVPPAPARPAGGAVTLTAIEPVWLRVYEGDGTQRYIEKQMAAGETFTVPSTARDPQILTGRPQALRVTVGTTVIPPLGAAERTIADVSLKPDALLARLTPAAAAPAPSAPAGTAAPRRPAVSVPGTPAAAPADQPSAAITPVDTPVAPPPPTGDPAQ